MNTRYLTLLEVARAVQNGDIDALFLVDDVAPLLSIDDESRARLRQTTRDEFSTIPREFVAYVVFVDMLALMDEDEDEFLEAINHAHPLPGQN